MVIRKDPYRSWSERKREWENKRPEKGWHPQ